MHAQQRDEWPGDARPVHQLVRPDAELARIHGLLPWRALAHRFRMLRARDAGPSISPSRTAT